MDKFINYSGCKSCCLTRNFQFLLIYLRRNFCHRHLLFCLVNKYSPELIYLWCPRCTSVLICLPFKAVDIIICYLDARHSSTKICIWIIPIINLAYYINSRQDVFYYRCCSSAKWSTKAEVRFQCFAFLLIFIQLICKDRREWTRTTKTNVKLSERLKYRQRNHIIFWACLEHFQQTGSKIMAFWLSEECVCCSLPVVYAGVIQKHFSLITN